MTNIITFSLEADISHDCPIAELNRFQSQYNVKFDLLKEFGPAGGNPLYNVTASSIDDLKKFFVEEMTNDLDEYEELYEPYIEMTIQTDVYNPF